MGIKDLNQFLNDRKLINNANISSLHGARIGIDGLHWLRSMDLPKEALQVAMGGIPLTLLNVVEKELEKLNTHNQRKLEITPVFVFNGISVKKPKKDLPGDEHVTYKRRQAWMQYEMNRISEAKSLFLASSQGSVPLDWINVIVQFLKDKGVEVFRAPYLAWAQLAKFLDRDRPLVHAVYGPDEILLFLNQLGPNDAVTHHTRLITKIADGYFEFIDKREILQTTGIANETFLDVCLLSGGFFQKTFPIITSEVNNNNPYKAFSIALDLINSFHGAEQLIQFYGQHNDVVKWDYLNTHLLNRNLIAHHPVLDSNCNCVLLDQKSAPSDMHEILGSRLPNELYYLMSSSLLSPVILSTLIYGATMETTPLVDSKEYRKAVDVINSSFMTIVHDLNDHYKNGKYSLFKWTDNYQETKEWSANNIELSSSQPTHTYPSSYLSQLNKYNKPSCDYSTICKNQPKSASDKSSSSILGPEETKALIYLHSLELLGYFDSSATLKQQGVALASAEIHPELTLLLFELCKNGFMTSHILSPHHKLYITDQNTDQVRFICRVLSLLPLTFESGEKSTQWHAHVNFDLMGFHSIAKIHSKYLRLLLESVGASLVLQKKTTSHNLSKVHQTLPLRSENNTGMGLLAMYLLTNTEFDNANKMFDACVKPFEEFAQVAIPFWEQCVRVVKLAGENYSKVAEDFEKADVVWNAKKNEWKNAKLFKCL
ncbi:hypothetical protein AKO1_004212 [Acrasis kona]|uniref:Uncharacterized protein n=1 Tax=Acrasis kona TaxID=1008807 RepID=A0AAW2YHM7_9EUKA